MATASDMLVTSRKSNEAKWLEERLSCCVCFEIFANPHTLTCLHSLCERCLDGLTMFDYGVEVGYQCPLCEEFCKEEDVRKNYLIAELLEFYEIVTNKNVSVLCKQCEGRVPTHRCVECKMELCRTCKKIHDKFESLQMHHSISLENLAEGIVIDKHVYCSAHPNELIKLSCVQCEKSMCGVCKATDHDGHKCESIEDALHRILPCVNDTKRKIANDVKGVKSRGSDITDKVGKISEQIAVMQEEVRKAYERKREKLDKDYEILLGQLSDMQNDIQSQKQEYTARIEKHVKEHSHVTDWVETVMDTAQGTSLLQELQSGVKTKLEAIAQNLKKTRSALDAATVVEDRHRVFMQKFEPASTLDGNMIGEIAMRMSDLWPIDFQKLCTKQAFCNPTVSLKFTAHQFFSVVNGQIWVPVRENGKACISIYALDGRYKSKITLPGNIKFIIPNAIVEWQAPLSGSSTFMVAVIASDSGLFALSEDWRILGHSQEGKFSDLCAVGDKIYALECEKQQVFIFQYVTETWNREGIIQLQIKSHNACKPQFNTLTVMNNVMYVYDVKNDTLIKYNTKGEVIHLYGEEKRGGDAPGRLCHGKLSGFDKSGTMLVCDEGHKRLQILTEDGRWFNTNVKNLDFSPRYAVALSQTSFCVLGSSGKHLHFFHLQ